MTPIPTNHGQLSPRACSLSVKLNNQMEREMCSYLDWELTVDNPILSNFEAMVKHNFRDAGYPTYSL